MYHMPRSTRSFSATPYVIHLHHCLYGSDMVMYQSNKWNFTTRQSPQKWDHQIMSFYAWSSPPCMYEWWHLHNYPSLLWLCLLTFPLAFQPQCALNLLLILVSLSKVTSAYLEFSSVVTCDDILDDFSIFFWIKL